MKLAAVACLFFPSAIVMANAQPATTSEGTHPVCIRPFDSPTGSIDHTHVVDPQTVLFYMSDGKVWKNSLRSPCPGLMFHGFAFLTHQDEVCSNAQGIRVIETGEVCQLGAFTSYTPPPAAN
jgi:hypothetical protein